MTLRLPTGSTFYGPSWTKLRLPACRTRFSRTYCLTLSQALTGLLALNRLMDKILEMETVGAVAVLSEYASLQGRLVRQLLCRYQPTDLERFRDLPNGELFVDQVVWSHVRHGAGVRFQNKDGVQVNAHVGMATHPEALDRGRLYEFLESRSIASVTFADVTFATSMLEIDRLLRTMKAYGVLSVREIGEIFRHEIFEITQLTSG